MTLRAPTLERVYERTIASERGLRADLSRARELPLRIVSGRLLVVLLFLVVPLFNPSIFQAGDERLYLGTVVVMAAVVLMLPSLLSGRFDWIVVGLFLAGLYVLEAGVLRGDLRLGIVGNAYRPLHAVLAFCALAVFLLGSDRHRWVRLFLVGGLLGCGLAVVNTVFPAFDPFAASRPELGYESRFLESERQSGAFVYPGNFGPYAAYVALVALVTLERLRVRLLSPNLYTAAFAAGLLGVVVSGSRAAGLGLLLGVGVVLWRAPRFRLPVAGVVVAAASAVAVALLVAGTFREIVESRILLAGTSLTLRLESWDAAITTLNESPVFGSGVMPNTIDSTLFYLLHVGGIVGLVIVAAMYWCTLVRPLRHRDWASLPIFVAVLGIGITQDVLGSPLSSWAIAAGVVLLAAHDREQEILAPEPRAPLIAPGRRWTAVAAAGLFLVLGVGIGALLGGRLPTNEPVQALAALPIERTVALPGDALRGSDVQAATDGDLTRMDEPLWLVAMREREARAGRYPLAGDDGPARLEDSVAFEGDAVAALTEFDVVGWDSADDGQLVALPIRRRAVEVWTMSGGGPPVRRGVARLPVRDPDVIRNGRLARWNGGAPDLFVVDRGPVTRHVTVRVFSGESRFRERLLEVDVPLPFAEATRWTIDVARVTGERPDLVLFAARGPSGLNEIHIVSGDSDFEEYILHVPTDFPADRAETAAFAVGTADGSPAVYAVGSGEEGAEVAVVPLRGLP